MLRMQRRATRPVVPAAAFPPLSRGGRRWPAVSRSWALGVSPSRVAWARIVRDAAVHSQHTNTQTSHAAVHAQRAARTARVEGESGPGGRGGEHGRTRVAPGLRKIRKGSGGRVSSRSADSDSLSARQGAANRSRSIARGRRAPEGGAVAPPSGGLGAPQAGPSGERVGAPTTQRVAWARIVRRRRRSTYLRDSRSQRPEHKEIGDPFSPPSGGEPHSPYSGLSVSPCLVRHDEYRRHLHVET